MYRKSIEAEMASQENQTIMNRMSQLPAVNYAIGYATDVVQRAKDYSPLVKSTLDTAEESVKSVAPYVQGVVDKLEKPIAVADNLACKTLDKLEETFPIITKSTEEITQETKALYDSKVGPQIEKANNLKNYGMEKVTLVKDYSVEKANQLLETPYGQALSTGMNKTLNIADQYVDYYLPPATDEEIKSAADEVASTKLYNLSYKLRHRIYRLTTSQMANMYTQSKQISQLADLFQVVKTNVDSTNQTMKDQFTTAQTKLLAMWEELSKEQKPEEIANASLQQKALYMITNATKQLVNIANNTATLRHTLPSSMQNTYTQAQQYATDLYTQMKEVTTKEKLTTLVSTQIQEKTQMVQSAVSTLYDQALKAQPLEWLSLDISIGDIVLDSEDQEVIMSTLFERTEVVYRHRPLWMN